MSNGWLATGDYGIVDDDGFLSYLGREDDMINTGGYSFFPAEVEAELRSLEGVRFIIAGVPDTQGVLGSVPWAFVVPDHHEAWSPKELLSLARRRLPAHMIPRRVVCIPNLPLTGSGKYDRHRTVDLYASKSKD